MKSRDLHGSPPAQGRVWVVILSSSPLATAAIFSSLSLAPLLMMGRITQPHPEHKAGTERRAAPEPCGALEPCCHPACPCWPACLTAPVWQGSSLKHYHMQLYMTELHSWHKNPSTRFQYISLEAENEGVG